VGKQWTARLVVDHLHRSEIEEAVNNAGPSDPGARIGLWSTAVTEKFNSLTDEQKTKYAVMAENWKASGPSEEFKQQLVHLAYWWVGSSLIDGPSEAEERTGKYVHGVLDQLETQLGVHAVMLVTYKGADGTVKISEHVYSNYILGWA
jgi:hypothetical protein